MKADMTALEKYLDRDVPAKEIFRYGDCDTRTQRFVFRKGFGFRNRERTLVPDGNTIFEFMI